MSRHVIERVDEAEPEPAHGWVVMPMVRGYQALPSGGPCPRPASKWFPSKAEAIAYTFGREPIPACRIVVDGCAPLPVLYDEAVAIRDELSEWLDALAREDGAE